MDKRQGTSNAHGNACQIIQLNGKCLKISANVLIFCQFSGLLSIISNVFRAFQTCWAFFEAAQHDRADIAGSVLYQTPSPTQESLASSASTISYFQ